MWVVFSLNTNNTSPCDSETLVVKAKAQLQEPDGYFRYE